MKDYDFVGITLPKEMLSEKPVYDKAPVLQGSAVILFDVQCPFQDGEFIYNVLTLASAWGIKQGISGGDFFNEGAFSLFLHRPEDTIWKEESKKATELIKVMLELVPEWMFILGNHDAFLLKKLAHQLDHEDLLRLVNAPNAVKATDYYWCLVLDSEGNKWRITHPRNVSVIHGRVPQRLSDKFGCNIIAGHGHLAGITYSQSGEYIAIDVGICCDPRRLDYAMERDNLRPIQNQGAVILREVKGKIYPYHLLPKFTDWETMKKLR